MKDRVRKEITMPRQGKGQSEVVETSKVQKKVTALNS